MVHPAQQFFPAQPVQVRAVVETYLMGQDQELVFALVSYSATSIDRCVVAMITSLCSGNSSPDVFAGVIEWRKT